MRSRAQIAVSPSVVAMLPNQTQSFTAEALDQFTYDMTTPPTFHWCFGGTYGGTVTATGVATIDDGLFTVSAAATPCTFPLCVWADGLDATASVAIPHWAASPYYVDTEASDITVHSVTHGTVSSTFTVDDGGWDRVPSPEGAVQDAVSTTITISNRPGDNPDVEYSFPADLVNSNGYGEFAFGPPTYDPSTSSYYVSVHFHDPDYQVGDESMGSYFEVRVTGVVLAELTLTDHSNPANHAAAVGPCRSEFAFFPLKSGRYHIRSDSEPHSPADTVATPENQEELRRTEADLWRPARHDEGQDRADDRLCLSPLPDRLDQRGSQAEPPEGAGEKKYDATVGSMIALLKYGSGMPFNRAEKLQEGLGIPLPASTQWDIVATRPSVPSRPSKN